MQFFVVYPGRDESHKEKLDASGWVYDGAFPLSHVQDQRSAGKYVILETVLCLVSSHQANLVIILAGGGDEIPVSRNELGYKHVPICDMHVSWCT